MKWKKYDLDRLEYPSFKYSEDLDFSNEVFSKQLNLLSLKDVHVEGNAKYDSFQECLMLDLLITGTMVIPCARTLEPVDYHFEIKEPVTYSFVDTTNEDAIMVNSNVIDTYEFTRECIILEIPLRVFKEGTTPMVSEEENKIDPRLAKLKDLLK